MNPIIQSMMMMYVTPQRHHHPSINILSTIVTSMSDKLAERIFAGCKDRNWTAVELLLEELSKDTRSSRVATLNTKFSVRLLLLLQITTSCDNAVFRFPNGPPYTIP